MEFLLTMCGALMLFAMSCGEGAGLDAGVTSTASPSSRSRPSRSASPAPGSSSGPLCSPTGTGFVDDDGTPLQQGARNALFVGSAQRVERCLVRPDGTPARTPRPYLRAAVYPRRGHLPLVWHEGLIIRLSETTACNPNGFIGLAQANHRVLDLVIENVPDGASSPPARRRPSSPSAPRTATRRRRVAVPRSSAVTWSSVGGGNTVSVTLTQTAGHALETVSGALGSGSFDAEYCAFFDWEDRSREPVLPLICGRVKEGE